MQRDETLSVMNRDAFESHLEALEGAQNKLIQEKKMLMAQISRIDVDRERLGDEIAETNLVVARLRETQASTRCAVARLLDEVRHKSNRAMKKESSKEQRCELRVQMPDLAPPPVASPPRSPSFEALHARVRECAKRNNQIEGRIFLKTKRFERLEKELYAVSAANSRIERVAAVLRKEKESLGRLKAEETRLMESNATNKLKRKEQLERIRQQKKAKAVTVHGDDKA